MAYRIHITSSGPRTGTTLLTEIFKSCFEIDCSCDHEASIAKSNSSFGHCETVLTKWPSGTKDLHKVLRFEKKLYTICVIRDPRDMIVSHHGKTPDQYYCGLNYWTQFLKDYENLKDHKQFMLIRYEDFTNNPNEIQKLIETKFPFLKRKHKFSEYHLYAKPDFHSTKALKKLRPIETKGVGNWKSHLVRVKQQLQKHGDITDSLKKFGYEIDSSWTDILEAAKGENSEFVSFKKETTPKHNNKIIYRALFNFGLEKVNINPEKVLDFLRPILNLNKKKVENM